MSGDPDNLWKVGSDFMSERNGSALCDDSRTIGEALEAVEPSCSVREYGMG